MHFDCIIGFNCFFFQVYVCVILRIFDMQSALGIILHSQKNLRVLCAKSNLTVYEIIKKRRVQLILRNK